MCRLLEIRPGDAFFAQALQLRHTLFFAAAGLSFRETADVLEGASRHLCLVRAQRLLACLRLTPEGDDRLRVSQMAVVPCCQGAGLGRRLLEAAMRRARILGVDRVVLDARLEAEGFYRRLGFEPKGAVFPSARTGVLHRRMEWRPKQR